VLSHLMYIPLSPVPPCFPHNTTICKPSPDMTCFPATIVIGTKLQLLSHFEIPLKTIIITSNTLPEVYISRRHCRAVKPIYPALSSLLYVYLRTKFPSHTVGSIARQNNSSPHRRIRQLAFHCTPSLISPKSLFSPFIPSCTLVLPTCFDPRRRASPDFGGSR